MRIFPLAFLLLLSCAAPDRNVQHALLDEGYDSIRLLGPAPECIPGKGTRWSARTAAGRWDTGVVCCSVDGCSMRRSAS